MHYISHQADAESNTYCICREAIYANYYPFYTESKIIIPIVSFAESHVTQRESLNYYVKRRAWWFKGNILHNIEEKKDSEIIELFLLLENHSLYNKERHPQLVQDKVNQILKQLNR